MIKKISTKKLIRKIPYANTILEYIRKLSLRGLIPKTVLKTVCSPSLLKSDIDKIIEFEQVYIHINLSSLLEWEIYFFGKFEPQITNFLNKTIKKDFVCLDFGANVGVHTLVMAWQAYDGKVISFEPHPVIFERLIQNI